MLRWLAIVSLLCAYLTASVTAAGTVTLAWDASTDTTTVTGYQVLYGRQSGVYGTSSDAGNVLQFSIGNLADSTLYFFVVRAYDALGNFSVYSNEVSYLTPTPPPPLVCTDPAATNFNGPLPCLYPTGDTTLPVITWLAPTGNITVPKKSKVTLSVLATDNVGVVKVDFYNGSQRIATVTAPFTFVWGTPAQRGTYPITATASDAAGNTRTTQAVLITTK